MQSNSTARVEFLVGAYALIRETLLAEAPPPEDVAFSFGFPSKRASAGRHQRIGEWHGRAIGETEKHLIIVHPRQWSEPLEVLHILAHEMCHAATPGCGHKAPFRRLATRIGLVGKPTATTAGPAFKQWFEAHKDRLPLFVSGALDLTSQKKQTTRMRLFECSCGIKVRAARDELHATCNECLGAFERKS